MKKFKEGDYVSHIEEPEYFEQCLSMKELHKNLKPGDAIITHRDNNKNTLERSTFIEFQKCNLQNPNSNTGSCRHCKGYLILSSYRNRICSGYTKKELSCVLKIIKKRIIPLFENEMFEL